MSTNKHQFLVTLDFSDPMGDLDVLEVGANVQSALRHWSDEIGIAPDDSEAACEGIGVEPMSVQAAKDILKEAGYLMVFWTENDIRDYDLNSFGEGNYEPLTEEEIGDIAYNIEENFDASIGVSWDTIREEIWETLQCRVSEEEADESEAKFLEQSSATYFGTKPLND